MTCSAATREKLRQTALRQWATPEIRQRMQDAMQEGHHSPEARERHRQAYFRNPTSPEARKKMQQTQRERYARLRAEGKTWLRNCLDCGKVCKGIRCRVCWRGPNHPAWKGGKVFITHHGYEAVNIDGRQYHIHRIVWERANGPLPKGHVIHHINENRRDNRLENLALMPRGEHLQFHRFHVSLKEEAQS